MADQIIVSTLIDNQVLSLFHNTDIELYYNLESLYETIKSTPIRTKKLVVTQDITNDNPNKSFTLLVDIVHSVFFKTDDIIFISDSDSSDIEKVDFLVKNESLPNVNVVTGSLTKEFVISTLRGDIATSNLGRKRKDVIRMRRSEYIELQKQKSAFPEEDDVELEDDKLSQIENQELEKNIIYDYTVNADIIQITGLNTISKSVFANILSQFLSGYGKTVIIDTDMEYFTLSYLISLTKFDYLNIPIKLFYTDPLSIVDTIKNTDKKLICLTATSDDYNKDYQIYYIVRTLFSLLKRDVQYILYETELKYILPSMRTIVVMDNNIVSILKTVPNLPNNSLSNMQFVAIDNSMESIAIKDSKVIASMVSTLLNVVKEIPIYKIDSLNLGGENTYDLYRYVNGETESLSNV